MLFWYKLADVDKWEKATLEGKEYKVKLYEETEDILDNFRGDSGEMEWWPLRRRDAWARDDKFTFDSKEEAYEALYAELEDGLFCKQHNC